MASVAILLGNTTYERANALPCCRSDVAAMEELLKGTQRFGTIRTVVDATADAMKSELRQALEAAGQIDEAFVYFSGHGVQLDDFYCCGTGFDRARPNETGLSTTELHDILRTATPASVVKIVDACNSGTALIKSAERSTVSTGLRHFVQMSSCTDEQDASAGDPLSRFTRNFCEAALRRSEGPVYYTDIISSLRDRYITDDVETPWFVTQGNGRGLFIPDVSTLEEFRRRFDGEWRPAAGVPVAADIVESGPGPTAPVRDGPARLDVAGVLAAAEATYPPREAAIGFLNAVFDAVAAAATAPNELYEITVEEHDRFAEPSVDEFIVRTLSRQVRSDEFATAAIVRRKKRRPIWEPSLLAAVYGDEYEESFDLELNCTLPRVQAAVTMVPKFASLDQFRLILTCVPGLQSCTVFENTTSHRRSDWNAFSHEGASVSKKWWTRRWEDQAEDIARAAMLRLTDAAERHATMRAGHLEAIRE